ncbi:thioesterase [Ephemerocybe angulata]|uniref:Thioesterase n=1 Tax=Ephemerocybe angulata TaxID=980116 RepID=A0A8H6HDH6_9AGAR|nr:thioesterase [Tulosesus angulatus]
MAQPNLKDRRLEDYGYILEYRTRWSDNDQYAHMNNAIYYHLFDSIVNTYLIEKCGLVPKTSPLIGLVVSSYCQFFAPVSFPDVLELGLRVNKLGSSSVSYEVGVFLKGESKPAAVGGYTHVFVGSESRTSTPMAQATREGLSKLLRPSGSNTAKL